MRSPGRAVEPHARERIAVPQQDEEEGHAGQRDAWQKPATPASAAAIGSNSRSWRICEFL
jgi:hypothetical protein